jgi:hypothetical protein
VTTDSAQNIVILGALATGGIGWLGDAAKTSSPIPPARLVISVGIVTVMLMVLSDAAPSLSVALAVAITITALLHYAPIIREYQKKVG